MKKYNATVKTFLGLCALPALVSAAPLTPTALGNGGEIYEVKAATYGELFPGEGNGNPGQTVMVLDVTHPGESTARLVVPATMGPETEYSPNLLYCKETGSLNVVWLSRAAGEASMHVAHYDGSEWSSTVDEIYFHPDGVSPLTALTVDELHLDFVGGASVDAERQVLHLVWPRSVGQQPMLGYVPVFFLNGALLGVGDALDLPHLNPTPGVPGHSVMAPIFRLTVADEDIDRVTLTFGSSVSQRVTSYDIDVVPMEIVHFAELIREQVLNSEGFDPSEISRFADTLGTLFLDGGSRRRLRSRVVLTPSVIEFVASETARWIRENGADYGPAGLAELAADAGSEALRLATSLFSSGSEVSGSTGVKSGRTEFDPSALVIDVSDLLDDTDSPLSAHVLDLRFAVEMALPDSQGSEISLFTSDDGRSFLASWLDLNDPSVLWYVESGFGGSWQPHRKLVLGESLSREQANELLQQRVR